MATTRCGYEYEMSTVEGHGGACCWRPVWGDRDRCLWHANEVEKPRDALEAHRPEPGERLDGAILRGVSLPNVSWLRETVLIGADFTDASLPGADFTGTDLQRATFRDVDAHGATFAQADVEDAIFMFVDLRGTDFEGTRLYRAAFTDVRVNKETNFGSHVIYEEALDRTREQATLPPSSSRRPGPIARFSGSSKRMRAPGGSSSTISARWIYGGGPRGGNETCSRSSKPRGHDGRCGMESAHGVSCGHPCF